MANGDHAKIIARGTPESAAMLANVQRAMAITARLNRLTFDDAGEIRALFSDLIGKTVDVPRDLSEQATELAKKEPRRPKRASPRGAISTAYYALFHLIVEDAANVLAPPAPSSLRTIVRRAFQHGSMLSARGDFTPLFS
jgi:hypothetical protein